MLTAFVDVYCVSEKFMQKTKQSKTININEFITFSHMLKLNIFLPYKKGWFVSPSLETLDTA